MPSFPTLEKCCCCYSTETGSKIIAWYIMIFNVLVWVNTLLSLYVYNSQFVFTEHLEEKAKANLAAESTKDAIEGFLFGLFLLIAVRKRIGCYVKIWIIVFLIYLTLTTIRLVAMLPLKIKDTTYAIIGVIIAVIRILIFLYFTWVVYSFYQEIKSD